jgi:hypothetical protein
MYRCGVRWPRRHNMNSCVCYTIEFVTKKVVISQSAFWVWFLKEILQCVGVSSYSCTGALFGDALSALFGNALSALFGDALSALFGDALSALFGDALSALFGDALSAPALPPPPCWFASYLEERTCCVQLFLSSFAIYCRSEKDGDIVLKTCSACCDEKSSVVRTQLDCTLWIDATAETSSGALLPTRGPKRQGEVSW